MPDFAPNYTARYRIHYVSLTHQHSMLWRIGRGTASTGLALMVAKVGAFLTSVKVARFTDWTILSAEYAPEDVDIFAPAALPTFDAGTAVLPTNPISQGTLAASFVGRSAAGQKAKMFLYGVDVGPEVTVGPGVADNFRVTSVENAAVGSAIATLNAGSPDIVGSDNFAVHWYSYVNTKYNDHWVARVR